MTKYKTSDKKPSEMFLNSLPGGGSHFMTCGYCGRDHYCLDAETISNGACDPDEEVAESYKSYLEEALFEQAKNPEGVVIHYDVDCVMTKDLNGMAFVIECPCNGLAQYEQFIWKEKNAIRRYLKSRIEQEAQWAQEQLTLNKLAGI